MAVVVEKTTTTTTTKQKKSTQYEVNLKRIIYKITALVVVKTTMTKQSTQINLSTCNTPTNSTPKKQQLPDDIEAIPSLDSNPVPHK